MSSGPNPYSSPLGPSGQPIAIPAVRPGWMTAICITAIILGALGLVVAVFSGIVLATGDRFQEMVQGMSTMGQPPGMKEVQQEMQKALQEVQNRWKPVTIVQTVLHFFVALGLVVGGAKALGLSVSGRSILVIAFCSAIVFEVLRLIPTVAIQMGTMDVMQEYMQRIMEASAPKGQAMPPQAQNAMATAMKASVMVGFAFTFFFVLAKVVFYAVGAWYLSKPHIRALCESRSGPASA